MRLLVTGGCGFIGSHFIRHIIEKPEVETIINLDCLTYAGAISNTADFAEHEKYTFINCDILNLELLSDDILAEITHVAHFAAESHVDRSITRPDIFLENNVSGTFTLLDYFETFNLDKFLYVSTDEVYGSVPHPEISIESSALIPSSPYSASKAAGEMFAMAYHKTYGLPLVITRSSNNYGSHQFEEKLIPVVIRAIRENKPIPVYGRGQNMRDWLHVYDNVRALWAVLLNGRPGSVYNVSSMKVFSNIDLISSICDIIDPMTRKLIRFIDDRKGHDLRYAPSSAKIRSELGWCPVESLASGLPDTIRWYMDR